MPISRVTRIVSVLFSVVHFAHSSKDVDLEAVRISLPHPSKCEGYEGDAFYLERACECDSACGTYGDCCLDAPGQSSEQGVSPSDLTCLNYGEYYHPGIYAVSKCGKNWNGLEEVKQNCEGSVDLKDIMGSAPMTSASLAVTYKNWYCAKCNNADMKSLQAFDLKTACQGLEDLSEEQIIDRIWYNQYEEKWGVNRVDAEGKSVFHECDIFFDVPSDLTTSVRFCRANVISECAGDWTRPQVAILCNDYMAVVVISDRAYRNIHCSVCNHEVTSGYLIKRPFSFEVLLDMNIDLKEVFYIGGKFMQRKRRERKCPINHKYNRYFKRCRKLRCAIPGYVVKNGRCVPPS